MSEETPAASEDWQALPKIDLHRHLEGSIPFDLIQRLAAEGRVPLPTDQALLAELITISPSDNASAASFLAPFEHIRKVFQNEEIIRAVSRQVIVSAAQEGIRYLELHVTPSALASVSSASAGNTADWVCQAVQTEAEAHDIEAKIIISLNRHEAVSTGEEAVQAAVDLQGKGVVGVDLAGDESSHGGQPFSSLLKEAKAAGLFVSMHAGEWAGAESVAFAIEEIQADRIIHGVHIMEDPRLVRAAQERNIPIVVCLTSNIQSGVVSCIGDHPLPLMLAAGLQVSLGTDDPSVSQTSLAEEFALAQHELGLGIDSLRGMMLAATQAAFLPARDKKALEARFQSWLGLAIHDNNANLPGLGPKGD